MQAVSAINIIVNVKILFIFPSFCCTRFCVIRPFAKCDEVLRVFDFSFCSFVGKIHIAIYYIIDHYLNKAFRLFKQRAVGGLFERVKTFHGRL